MERNLDRRVEVLCRIAKPELVRDLRDHILETYLRDNDRAYVLGADGYTRVEPPIDETPLSAQETLLASYTHPDHVQEV